MNSQKTASLNEVNLKNITLKELIEFIEEMKAEYPAAIRVLGKKLSNDHKAHVAETDYPERFDDDKIIASLGLLQGAMEEQAATGVTADFVLNLHGTFGFGKKRIMRLIGNIAEGKTLEMVDNYGKHYDAEALVAWCEARGMDYQEVVTNVAKAIR